MQILGPDQIRRAVTVAGARAAVHDAFCRFADGSVLAPNELAMKLDHGGELHVKGAYLGGDWIAFKAATGAFPGGGNSGFTSVIDATTGAPAAILQDGGWLTEMRTAAASAVTAVALARPASSTLAILGGGFQAGFQVEAIRDAFTITSTTVWSRTAATAERFAAEHNATAAGSVAEAVADADIVICCTPSHEPLLTLNMLRPGTHVVAMGSDMVGKHELARDLVEGCARFVCDSVDVSATVGELQHVPSAVATAINLGDVLVGTVAGRTSDDEITVADLCGLGIQDAAMAELVMANTQGLN